MKVSSKPDELSYWNSGPHVQFGISTFLCEAAGAFTSKQQDLDSGVVLIRSIAQYYQGPRR